MSEIVALQDMVATYSSGWLKIANTQGHDHIQIKDRFREQGFGDGAEELEVEGVDFSPIGGASRIFVRRAANNTKAETHKLGCVFLQTNQAGPITIGPGMPPVFLTESGGLANANYPATSVTMNNGAVGLAEPDDIPDTIVAGGTEYANPAKRGRGRPKGSLNKSKQIPDWPSV